MPVSLDIKRSSLELKKLKQRLNTLDGIRGDVGFFSDKVYTEGERSGVPVATIAYSNNEGLEIVGTTNIPARPFFTTAAFEMNQEFRFRAAQVFLGSIRGGGLWKQELNNTLDSFKDIVKDNIVDWNTPPNAEKTEKIKGRNDPLVDTGVMRDSVDTRITRGG